MPEGTAVPVQEKYKALEAQEYQWAKTCIEASKRIATEIRTARSHGGKEYYNNPSVVEINRVLAEKRGAIVRADAREYDEQRIKMVYHSHDDTETVSEELVFFLKPNEKGDPEMLEVDGRPLFLNGDLFDIQYPTRLTHNLEEPDIYVPTVAHTGQITSLVRVMEKSRPLDLSNLERSQS